MSSRPGKAPQRNDPFSSDGGEDDNENGGIEIFQDITPIANEKSSSLTIHHHKKAGSMAEPTVLTIPGVEDRSSSRVAMGFHSSDKTAVSIDIEMAERKPAKGNSGTRNVDTGEIVEDAPMPSYQVKLPILDMNNNSGNETEAIIPFHRRVFRFIGWALGFIYSVLVFDTKGTKPTATTVIPNLICALGIIPIGIVSLVYSWNNYNTTIMSELVPTNFEVPPEVEPTLTSGNSYIALLITNSSLFLTTLTLWRQHIYFLSLFFTILTGLAERRGGLKGTPFFVRFYNVFNNIRRVFVFLSLINNINSVFVMKGKSLIFTLSIALAALLCRLISLNQTEMKFAVMITLYNNVIAFMAIYIYM